MIANTLTRRLLSSQGTRLASTLVVAEPLLANGSVTAATQSTVTAAQQLPSDSIALLVVDAQAPTSVPEGVSEVYHVPLEKAVAETVANAIVAVNKHDYVLAPASKFGSTVVPRAAALLNVSPVTDVLEIVSSDTFVRPMYAGNALAKVKANDNLKVLSIRPTAFDKAALTDSLPPTESVDLPAFDKAEFLSESVSESERPDLTSATTVVSGGRGLQTGDNFALLEQLADNLQNAAVGASRAAVDAGMCPNDMQVGQTGKVVAPDLYMAVGISGAIQHLSGMKDSKTIVAINQDPEAPIFAVADYGLKADLFEAVPELTEKLSK